MNRLECRQVAWFEVHEFVQPHLAVVGTWPLLGSPAWCALDDHDPAKWAALLDAAQHWSLRLDTLQEARCTAAKDIAGAANWGTVAREIHGRANFYAARPWLRRVRPS